MIVALCATDVDAKENDAGVIRQTIEVFYSRFQELIGTALGIGSQHITKHLIPRTILGCRWPKVL